MNRLSPVDADAGGVDQEFVHDPVANAPDASHPGRQCTQTRSEAGQLRQLAFDAATSIVQLAPKAVDVVGNLEHGDGPTPVH